jgi:hypothetical protein
MLVWWRWELSHFFVVLLENDSRLAVYNLLLRAFRTSSRNFFSTPNCFLFWLVVIVVLVSGEHFCGGGDLKQATAKKRHRTD